MSFMALTGTARTKKIARSHLWRPNLDKDIEYTVRNCHHCARTATTHHTHHYPPGCGPSNRSREYLLTFHLSRETLPHRGRRPFQVARGHWSNGNHYSQSHNRRTAHHLCKVWYARKSTVVTDNGPPFQSEEYNRFLKLNGIQRVLVAPYHPSNGQAEQFV